MDKSRKQYMKGIVHNYSLQRWTDQDIVNFLCEEKKIRIARSTVTTIKNKVEEQAGNWYLELRESSYRTIAFYKERLDSLLSYQKKLNEIMDISEVPEIKIRAIAELHRVEMSLRSIFQEFPHEQFQIKPETEREPTNCQCMSTGTITHSNCRYCKQVWCPLTLKQDWCPNVDCGQGIKGCKFQPWMSISNGFSVLLVKCGSRHPIYLPSIIVTSKRFQRLKKIDLVSAEMVKVPYPNNHYHCLPLPIRTLIIESQAVRNKNQKNRNQK